MFEDSKESSELSNIRRRAEAELKRRGELPIHMDTDDVRRLVHELRTHQLELEMQNEKLRQTHLELIEARDRYAELYNFAPVGYLTTDEKDVILEANLTAVDILGVAREDILEKRLSDFITRQDQDLHYLYRRRLLETTTPQIYEFRIRKGDETHSWIRMECCLVKGEDPVGRYRCVFSAVDDLRKLEEQLRVAERLKSVGALAGGVAHEFNNLLMGINGYVEFLQESVVDLAQAADAGEAEEIFRQHGSNIDMLLTDVVMPGLSGHQLYARLTAHLPELKVLFMSGYDEQAAMNQNARESGLNFVQKPLSMGELNRKIRIVLD